MATTKITADYSQNNIYFYRYSNEQENEVALIQHNLYTDEEKILLTTDVLVGMRVYDNCIYYFDHDNHDIYAIDKTNLESHIVYSLQDAFPQNNYIKIGSKFIYLDGGVLNILENNEKYQIDSVWNFNTYKDIIYYVDVNADTNEWSIKRILDTKKLKIETVLSMDEIRDSITLNNRFESGIKIDNICICNNVLYFTIGEYMYSNINYLCAYDLNNGSIKKITDDFVREYQITEKFIYYSVCSEDNELKKYSMENNTTQKLIDNVYSFKLTEDKLLIYKLYYDDTLYIKGKDIFFSIPDTLG